MPLSVDTASSSGATSPLASPKGNVFKRPGDPISLESPAVKRARYLLFFNNFCCHNVEQVTHVCEFPVVGKPEFVITSRLMGYRHL